MAYKQLVSFWLPMGLSTVGRLGSPILTFKSSWKATDSPASGALSWVSCGGGESPGKAGEGELCPGPCLRNGAELSLAAVLPWAARALS